MRDLGAHMVEHLAGEVRTLSTLVKVTRLDGVMLGLTDADHSIVCDGLTYEPSDGAGTTAIECSSGSGVGDMEMTGFLTDDRITDDDLSRGFYDWAVIEVRVVDRNQITETKPLAVGQIGAVTKVDGKFTASVLSLNEQCLERQVGDVTSPTCRCKRLGDARCKVDMTGYRFARVVTAIGVAASAVAGSTVRKINCGGAADGDWEADTGYSGGSAIHKTHAVSVDVTNAAPESIYQWFRDYGNPVTYTLTGFDPGRKYTVRIHTMEWTDDSTGRTVGRRVFNVRINGHIAWSRLDPFAAAGGTYRAVVSDMAGIADASGRLVIKFEKTSIGNPLVCGIEVISTGLAAIEGGISFADAHLSGYFDHGVATFTSGANVGRSGEVKAHRNDGAASTIAWRVAPPFTVSVGDEMTIEAGCSREFPVCDVVFANATNFHGEPYLPGNDKVLVVGRG